MNAKLTQDLYQKYPSIFTHCCGFEHDDGWYAIIDTLCDAMSQSYSRLLQVDEERARSLGIGQCEDTGKYWLEVLPPQVVATQVKEKFGTLRFYRELEHEPRFHELAYGDNPMPEARAIADQYHSFYQGIVHYAKILSARTCEVTGKRAELHTVGGNPFGWRRTLNREFAKTDKSCVSRKYAPIADASEKFGADPAR